MSVYYVYLLLDPTDYYKPFYVGKGKNDRMFSHLQENSIGENRFKDNKIAKIRRAGAEPVPMKWIESLEEDEAYEVETSLIERFGRRNNDPNGILTNICIDLKPPSPLGRQVSSKARQRIGDKQRGDLNHRFGRTWTDEQKLLRSKISKELGLKPPVRSGLMSDEQKKKIAEANRGKKRSPEICAKLSEQRRGRARRSPSPETVEKIRQSNLGKVKRKWTEEEKIEHRKNQAARWSEKTEVELAIHGEKIRKAIIKKRGG